jgi:hypothetical protein
MPALRLLCLGYRSLCADYYWLRALAHFGDDGMHVWLYPNLEPFVRRVVTLDPYFARAYFFAGTALTVHGMDAHVAVELLEQGRRYCPDDWHIPFLLGFNRYYFLGDYLGGAEALAAAAKFPGAPEVAGPLAARLTAEGGAPEVGLALVDSLLEGVHDERLRQEYLSRRQLLELEVQLRGLNQAARAFAARLGRPPRTVSELVTAGFLPEIPDEALGGTFLMAADGTVKSSNDERRLRMNTASLGARP